MNKTEEKLVNSRVTYTLEVDGVFYLVENVPAKVNVETGEQHFSPDTIERVNSTVLSGLKPKRVVETPVYEYSD